MKAMTLRISDERHIQLVWIAQVHGTSVQAEVREAIAAYIDARCADPEFQKRLNSHREKQEVIYDRLTRQMTMETSS